MESSRRTIFTSISPLQFYHKRTFKLNNMNYRFLHKTIIGIGLFLGLLICSLPTQISAQDLGPAASFNAPIQLNGIRTQAIGPNRQQPPYEWSGVYVSNSFDAPANDQAIYVRDSSLCQDGVQNTSDFNSTVKMYYNYATDGRLQQVNYVENVAGTWQNLARKHLTYANGRISQYRLERWDANNQVWQDNYLEQRAYDANGRLESVMKRTGINNMEMQMRSAYSYDENGNLSRILNQTMDNGWNNHSQQTFQNNEVGIPELTLSFAWNGSGWDSLSKESSTFEAFGFQWETYSLSLKDENSGNLEPVIREQYGYNRRGYWRWMTQQVWDKDQGVWENAVREEYDYTNNGIWTSWLQQGWENGDWVNTIRQRYNPNGEIREDLLQAFNTNNQTWENATRVLNKFDENGNLEREAGPQSWAGQGWVNSEASKQCFHNYSLQSIVSNRTEMLPQLDCLLLNPYKMASPIHCDAMEPGRKYQVQLMDLNGRSILRKNVDGGQAFSLDRPGLSTGIYYLNIYENGQPRFSQKLLISH